jgi:hypothetical protein
MKALEFTILAMTIMNVPYDGRSISAIKQSLQRDNITSIATTMRIPPNAVSALLPQLFFPPCPGIVEFVAWPFPVTVGVPV